MRFTYNGTEYRIRFQYSPRKPKHGERVETVCFIEGVTDEKPQWGERSQWAILSAGQTSCSPLDQFRYEDGRRLSFERAMEAGVDFDKGFRGALWLAFRGRARRHTDTERLDWLEKNVADMEACERTPGILQWEVMGGDQYEIGTSLRETIDAAMQRFGDRLESAGAQEQGGVAKAWSIVGPEERVDAKGK